MTSTPQGPLDEPVDSAAHEAGGQDDALGQDSVDQASVSGSPAAADSDLGYSRGSEGESAEQAGQDTGASSDYLDRDTVTGGGGGPLDT